MSSETTKVAQQSLRAREVVRRGEGGNRGASGEQEWLDLGCI